MVNEPKWEDLLADGRVVWDALSAYGLAVYPGDGGDVVILTVENGKRSYTTVAACQFAGFTAAVQRAVQDATEICLEMDVAYEAHLAIEKARGG
jgi:hypothetical protein